MSLSRVHITCAAIILCTPRRPRVPYSVMAGLGPAIHERLLVDPRAKPGHERSGVPLGIGEEGGMERRMLGGLEVSAVGLGCATMTPFYDAPDPASAIATIRRARDLGVDFLDTSDAYGAGRNEELIARAVAGHRGDYLIASKFGNVQLQGGPRFADGHPEYLKECCDKSLQRLQTDVIDLYYIHRVDADVPIEDTVGAMAELVKAGKVRALGICFVAYSPLGRGFLTGRVTSLDGLRDGDARRRMPRFQGANLARNLALVEELKAHAAAERCTPAQLALAWLLSRRPFIVPIPGTSHVHRLEENAAAAGLRISADTADALDHIFMPG